MEASAGIISQIIQAGELSIPEHKATYRKLMTFRSPVSSVPPWFHLSSQFPMRERTICAHFATAAVTVDAVHVAEDDLQVAVRAQVR